MIHQFLAERVSRPRCVLCGGVVRRRWWQWGPLTPLRVHGHADAALCRSRLAHPAHR